MPLRISSVMDGIERWAGKVALVTGASSGIGRSVARRLSNHGMRIALVARREERLREIAAELPQDQTLILPVDMRDESRLLEAFERIRATWGGVDVLVNNAGVGYSVPLIAGESTTSQAAEQWREMLELNILALCLCTREAVQDMLRRGSEGHVFHLSSLAAHRVTPGSGVYGASKAAVRSLAESLRIELYELEAPIRVTAISPGFVESEFHARYYGSRDKAETLYRTSQPLQADDIADAIEYALGTAPYVQVHDLLIRSRMQRT